MWALKPPRRPAKKKINQETPERTPPEPDAAPEQALPPHSAWAWSETTDVVDSLLSLGGAYTEARRAGRLLAYQTAHGGIKQFFGAGPEAGKCSACVPASNAAYGDGEAPLMFDGDEPLTDSLYGLNFALIGLREAFGATGDGAYGDAEAALAAYLAAHEVAVAREILGHRDASGCHESYVGSCERAGALDRARAVVARAAA